MRYFLKLAYNGAPFHGWQSQPNAISIQSTIEDAVTKILREKIAIVGAGRTDTGVNAREMYAHFDFDRDIKDKKKFILSLNSMVGKDIGIEEIIIVDKDAHARFDATERTYKYFVSFKKNAFQKEYSWKSPSFLNIDLMNQAADILKQTKDFTSFAKLHSDAKTNFCDVRVAEWQYIEKDKEAFEFIGNLDNGIVFTITADRFLRNMVRAIVGTLIEVGRGKMSLSQFKDVIDKKNRSSAGTSMPAHALFLWRVKYPFIH